MKNILLNDLKSGKETLVINAIEKLMDAGDVSYLPDIFELLKSNPSQEVRKQITSLLSQLKPQEAVPVLIEAIRNHKEIRKDLISACWSNGLDYREYMSDFIDWTIESDFETQFEAYSVVTNMECGIPEATCDVQIAKLESAIKSSGNPTTIALLEDLINVLTMIKQGKPLEERM